MKAEKGGRHKRECNEKELEAIVSGPEMRGFHGEISGKSKGPF
jgi:hypothetical protein